MKLEGEATLLRVNVRNTDKYRGRSAADALVEYARSEVRSEVLSGATLMRGILGLDVAGHILESSAFSLVDHQPVIVEIVDSPKNIGRFLTVVTNRRHLK